MTPLWLAAPWIYGRLTGTIDHVWLRRRYTPAEAERQFVRAVQVAGTEDELALLAGESLSDIFQAPAEVHFGARPEPSGGAVDGLMAPLEQQGACFGWIALAQFLLAFITLALNDIARAIGMTDVAKAAGITREGLYKALSDKGDPRLSTLLGVTKALGIRLAAVPADKAA